MWKKKVENIWYATYAFFVTLPTAKKKKRVTLFFMKKRGTLLSLRDLRFFLYATYSQKKYRSYAFFQKKKKVRYAHLVTRPTINSIRYLLPKKIKIRAMKQFPFSRGGGGRQGPGLGTLNPRFVARPLELGLGTHNPRFVCVAP